MNKQKAKRAFIQIAGIELEAFQLADGEYVMSQSQVAEAVGKDSVYVLRFVTSERAKDRHSKTFSFYTIPIQKDWQGRSDNQTIKAIPIDVATKFWGDQAYKGNTKAIALMCACAEEVLRRRCDRAFNNHRSEDEHEELTLNAHSRLETWLDCRSFLTDAHISFYNKCQAEMLNGAWVHDQLTLGICGKTAKQLKAECELINGNTNIGLNHIEDKVVLLRIAKAKLEFSRLRAGTVHRRIKKAVEVALAYAS